MNSIGQLRRQAGDILQNFGLGPLRKLITREEVNRVAVATGCAPLRRRQFDPEATFWLMLTVAVYGATMTGGLSTAWGLVCALFPFLQEVSITDAAFCQWRGRLPLSFWRQLWLLLRTKYEAAFGSQLLWKGKLRLLAADGTEVAMRNVPELVDYFGRPKTGRGESKAPQGRLVALCSVLTGYCVDFEFISRCFSERDGLAHLIRRLQQNDLVLLDRGFFPL